MRASLLRKGEDWDGGPPPHRIPATAETAISCGRWPVRSRARQVDFSLLMHPASQAPAPTRGPPPSRCRKVAAGAYRHTQRPKIRGRFRGQLNWTTRLPLDRHRGWASTVGSLRLLVPVHRGSKRRCIRYVPLKFLPISIRLVYRRRRSTPRACPAAVVRPWLRESSNSSDKRGQRPSC